MLEIQDLSFAYSDGIPIFEKINLNLSFNEITLLKGTNGCGKTTLCRLIMKFLKCQSGNIIINNINTDQLTTEQISEGITYLKQEPAANVVAATAAEDLSIWLQKFRKKIDPEDKIETALQYFGMQELSEQPVWELSSGQLKRIGLSALLLNKEKYWILDEPTSGLDDSLIEKLMQLIKSQKEKNKGMLIISHRANLFRQTADKFFEIKDKKIFEIL